MSPAKTADETLTERRLPLRPPRLPQAEQEDAIDGSGAASTAKRLSSAIARFTQVDLPRLDEFDLGLDS